MQIVWRAAKILKGWLLKLLSPFQCFLSILASWHKPGELAQNRKLHLVATEGQTDECNSTQNGNVHRNSSCIPLRGSWGVGGVWKTQWAHVSPVQRSTSAPWGWVKDGLPAISVRFFASVSFWSLKSLDSSLWLTVALLLKKKANKKTKKT